MIIKLKIIYRHLLSLYRELNFPNYLSFGLFELKFRLSKLNKGMKDYLSLPYEKYEFGERLFSGKNIIKR